MNQTTPKRTYVPSSFQERSMETGEHVPSITKIAGNRDHGKTGTLVFGLEGKPPRAKQNRLPRDSKQVPRFLSAEHLGGSFFGMLGIMSMNSLAEGPLTGKGQIQIPTETHGDMAGLMCWCLQQLGIGS